ncbi:NosD domain-containing protein [Salinibaculum rarum]|uniref:NosD domain-containing protein n=1 Tax=Salinibaculum rarum TaxID=3058903 RepID=UPI00265F6193|nr:NosD domain-containing protein [Salinibaculum sp. KK48]
MKSVVYAGTAVALALLLAASGFAASPAGGDQLSPVPFDETLTTGLTGVDVQQAETAGYVVPKGQVFYSQYQYVVGYYGMESLVTGVTGSRHTEQFGQPLAVFVTDLSGTDPQLTDEGYVTLSNSIARGWTRTADAWFVVGTPARTPAGPTTVPFDDRAAAQSFADEYDGEVIDWDGLKDRLAGQGDRRDRQPPTAKHQQWANETVEQAQQTRDRPTSVVVGEDAATLAAAVEQAPANTTVEIPPGRYDTNLTIRKPLTLRGAGTETVLDGGTNGTVVTVRSPRVGITDLRFVGVGESNAGNMQPDNGSAWDKRIRLAYGYGDAAIRMSDAHRSLVENVTIDTPSNGIVALNSTDAVVRNIEVDGTEEWRNGFMSVLPMYSRMVVEDSSFNGGRDAVYTHYSDGTVIRNNEMENLRYGYHEMYTSNTLALNNTMRDTNTGIILMTRPTGNVLVGNDVRDSDIGISTVGGASYTTDNVLVNNDIGLSIGTSRSVYRDNTIVENSVGVRSSTMLPTNDVFENDIVANDRPVSASLGTLNSWALEGRGNYWGTVPGLDRNGDGVIDRTYRPTDAVDRTARHSAGSYTLAHAPTVQTLRQFQQSVPGLRGSTIVDPSPLAAPVNPDRLDALNVTTP